MEEGVEEQPDQPINNILQEILREVRLPYVNNTEDDLPEVQVNNTIPLEFFEYFTVINNPGDIVNNPGDIINNPGDIINNPGDIINNPGDIIDEEGLGNITEMDVDDEIDENTNSETILQLPPYNIIMGIDSFLSNDRLPLVFSGHTTEEEIMERSFQEQIIPKKKVCPQFLENLSCEVYESNTGESCAICQEQFVKGDSVIKLPCENGIHMFHKGDDPVKCMGILPWFKENNNCPICRTEFPEDKMEPDEDSNGDNEPDENDEPDEPDDENQILDGPPFTISSPNNINIFNSIIRNVHEIMYDEEVQQAIINSLD